jgi:hypothetical protein
MPSRDSYSSLLRGRHPYSVPGFWSLIQWVQSALQVLLDRRDTVLASRFIFTPAAFGADRNIRHEEYLLLARICADLDRLILLQSEQLQHVCDVETGHVWIPDTVHSLEVCNVCDAVRRTDADELPAHIVAGTESD